MTIQITDRKAGPFLSGTALPFEFKVFSKEDIAVIYTNAEGVEVVLVLDSDYSVTLNADQDNNPGGTATLTTPIISGDRANIIGDLAYDQGTDIRNQGGFEPEIIEDALDRATIQIQQLKEISDRTLKTAPGDSRTGDELLADIFEADASAAASAAAAEASASRVDLGALDQAVADSEAAELGAQTAQGLAETAQGLAENARDQSQLQASNAEASAAQANESKVESQSARDAAFVNADVFPDIAAGLAGTVVGEQFQVVAGDLIIRYRHDTGPVATEVARYQYGEVLDRVISGGSSFVVVDDADNVVLEVTPTEILHPAFEQVQNDVDEANTLTAVIDNVPSGGNSFALTDDENNVVLEVTPTEIRHPVIEQIQGQLESIGQSPDLIRVARTAEPRDPQWNDLQLLAGVSLIAMMGQSNSQGNDAIPAISTADSPWALRFIGGVRPADNRATPIRDAFAPLSEFTNGSVGETSASGSEQSLRQYVQQEEGIDLIGSPATMLFVNHSAPGSTIEAGIASGTSAFNNMVTSFSAGATVANSNGDPFAVAAVLLDIGESNQNNGTTQATYVTLNTTFRSDLQAQAQAAGINRPLPVFINQMNTIVPGPVPAPVDGSVRPNIALAQLQLAREQDYFCLACPSYQLPYFGPTNIHYSATGQKIKGAYLGRAMKRWLLDGIKPRPVAPLSARKQGKFVMVKLDVQSRTPIVIDSAAFPDAVNFGVQVVDATQAPLSIVSVSIAWGDTILIELASATPAPAFFRYAWTGTNSGSNLGKLKGCIRDTVGNDEIFDPDGLNYPLHNWMVTCEEAIV